MCVHQILSNQPPDFENVTRLSLSCNIDRNLSFETMLEGFGEYAEIDVTVAGSLQHLHFCQMVVMIILDMTQHFRNFT